MLEQKATVERRRVCLWLLRKNLPPVMSEAIVVLARARPTAGGPPPPRPRSLEADRGKCCHLFRGFYALRTCHIQDVGSILAACSCSFYQRSSFVCEELHTRWQNAHVGPIQERKKSPSETFWDCCRKRRGNPTKTSWEVKHITLVCRNSHKLAQICCFTKGNHTSSF